MRSTTRRSPRGARARCAPTSWTTTASMPGDSRRPASGPRGPCRNIRAARCSSAASKSAPCPATPEGTAPMRHRVRLPCLLAAALALGAGTAHAASRALLIGVADVPGNPLPGIDLDIDNMKKVADLMGFKPGEVKVIFNQQATYANVKQALSTWARDGVGPDDRVLIYFSGHGTRVPDPSPDNANGADDALVMHDVERARVAGKATLKNVLIGHEFGAALAAIPSHDILVLVDACHSGSATRDLPLGNGRLGVSSGVQKFFSYPGMPEGGQSTRALKMPSGNENYAALSAARDDEFAVGTEQGGLFTLGVVDAIESASRAGQHPTVIDLRNDATTYI